VNSLYSREKHACGGSAQQHPNRETIKAMTGIDLLYAFGCGALTVVIIAIAVTYQ
jgi:hypothetical protein